jgi:hypothetical protein
MRAAILYVMERSEDEARCSEERAGSSAGAGRVSCLARRVVTEVLRSDLLDRNVPGDTEEAGGREVTVERERMADALRAHDGEAGRVDEAEVLVGVLPQQTECTCFGLVMDVMSRPGTRVSWTPLATTSRRAARQMRNPIGYRHGRLRTIDEQPHLGRRSWQCPPVFQAHGPSQGLRRERVSDCHVGPAVSQ